MIEAKQKAEELVNKFFNAQSSSPCSWSDAKRYAFIVVDEIDALTHPKWQIHTSWDNNKISF